MEIIKELFNKQNRSTSLKMILGGCIYSTLFYLIIYSIAWLDYNIFY